MYPPWWLKRRFWPLKLFWRGPITSFIELKVRLASVKRLVKSSPNSWVLEESNLIERYTGFFTSEAFTLNNRD